MHAQNNKLDLDLGNTNSKLDDAKDALLYSANKTVANSDNIVAMGADSNLENIRQNLNYMMWTAGATIAIFAIIKASR